ncbi:MAG: hypothetical protein A2Y25_08420 [Candidatus Melainabacteria bacterium GWF2_37_15]|nr:MAG: hypothetical protein A2Y25_08420 [Candidatus Melainabacteria bacterium GWF2_37_15]
MINSITPGNIAVLDTFRPEFPNVDVNGDRCADYISHGEAVMPHVKKGLKGDAKVIPFEISEIVNNNGKLEQRISVESIIAQLTKIEKRDDITHIALASNLGKVDFSTGFSEEGKKEFLYTRLDPPLTIDEIQENRSFNRNEIRKMFDPNADVGLFLKKMEELGKTKKIFCSTGNYGKDFLGLNAVANNTILVGFMDGAFKLHPESADNQFVDVFAKGVFESRPIWENGVIAGYDITEDGKIDVPIERIAGYEAIREFQGQTTEQALTKKEDYKAFLDNLKKSDNLLESLKLFPQNKLVSMDFFMKCGFIPESSNFEGFYTEAKTLLDMFTCETEEDYEKNPKIFFKIQGRKMVYDSPWKEIKHGASYATPVALNQAYNEDVARAGLNLKI